MKSETFSRFNRAVNLRQLTGISKQETVVLPPAGQVLKGHRALGQSSHRHSKESDCT